VVRDTICKPLFLCLPLFCNIRPQGQMLVSASVQRINTCFEVQTNQPGKYRCFLNYFQMMFNNLDRLATFYQETGD
jgi:hypothetical protein